MERPQMRPVVVLSGGMDSATALAVAVKMFGAENVKTITFNYGSKHNAKENVAAAALAERYGVSNKLISLPFVNELFKSDLLASGGEVPEGHYAEDTMKRTVVPYRNAIMLSIAAGYAASVGGNSLWLGNHAGDHAVYPDCREEFTKPFEEALLKGDWNPVRVDRPFEKVSKADIVKAGAALGLPYELTWTCYKGGEKHCGRCGTCVERREAFHLAGVPEPTEYEDPEYYKSVVKI